MNALAPSRITHHKDTVLQARSLARDLRGTMIRMLG
jgi:hypothetical protein